WDAASATWKRAIFGSPEVVASGKQLAPKNIVVMFVNYVGGDPNHSNIGAEAQLTGTGKALVFTAGKEITGTWSRPDKSRPAQLLNAAGQPIALTPGQTWGELPDVSYSVTKTPSLRSGPPDVESAPWPTNAPREPPASSADSPRCCEAASSWTLSTPIRRRSPRTRAPSPSWRWSASPQTSGATVASRG